MTGHVTAQLEARLPVTVKGVSHSIIVDAIVDTGFDGDLVLTPASIDQLKLEPAAEEYLILGDGSATAMRAYRTRVEWHDRTRQVKVLESADAAYVGMRLLRRSRLTIEVVRDGAVSVERME